MLVGEVITGGSYDIRKNFSMFKNIEKILLKKLKFPSRINFIQKNFVQTGGEGVLSFVQSSTKRGG